MLRKTNKKGDNTMKKTEDNEKAGIDRRLHFRFPTITIVKEVVIFVTHPRTKKKIVLPAIMYNLSAGGIAIVTFEKVPIGAIITLNLNLDGINLQNVTGKVVRVEGRNVTFLIAIDFTNLTKELKKKITMIANDADICETRIMLGEKHACKKKCTYYSLCTNPVKKKYA